MWTAVQQRLDANWRRILFLPWTLLMVGGTVFTGLAAFHLYEAWMAVREVPENCPLILAQWKAFNADPVKTGPNPTDVFRCFYDAAKQTSLLNVKLLGMEAGRLFLWAALLGFFIFTHGWSRALRSFWMWINLRTPQA
ncbi:hypothetical protein SAMN05216304_11562 [Bosea sp. OK403]|uniref:hypothetical protein n=1 Tax=Bosea sp. OK403 TaxID=1855286 RepID=UPI0008E225B4|nr:hypothetical protein [Bosea sp. OK403]SFJ80800.1 hypothetical protein SAMN05216304_11562 [Bosea sp. OK403]